MKDKMEAYNALYDKLMNGENEKYVPDGTVLSLAVYSLVDGRLADSYFLYATDYEAFSEPYARISVAADSCKVLCYEDTENHPFQAQIQVPEGFCEEEIYRKYADAYMDIRDFAFRENLDEGQKDALGTYLKVFQEAIRHQFEACYLEMAGEFIRWADAELKTGGKRCR